MIAVKGNGQTCRLERRGDARDDIGGRRSDWSVVAGTADTPCWPQPANSRTVQAYASRQLAVTTSVFVATELEAVAGDRLIVSDRDGEDTTTLKVVGAPLDQAGLGHLWRIDGEEWQ